MPAFNIRAWFTDGGDLSRLSEFDIKEAVSPHAHMKMRFVDFGTDTPTIERLVLESDETANFSFSHFTVLGLVPASFRRGVYENRTASGTIEVGMTPHALEMTITSEEFWDMKVLLRSMKRGETKYLVDDWSGEEDEETPDLAKAASRIVDALVIHLSGPAMKNVWDSIDQETRDEARKIWRGIILRTLAETGAKPDLRKAASAVADVAFARFMKSAIAKAKSLEVVKFLVSMGADINAPLDGSKTTPLILAAKEGVLDVVGFLLKGGADPNIVDAEGKTALDHLPLPPKPGKPMPISDSNCIASLLLHHGAKPVTARWKDYERLDELRAIYEQTGPGCGG